MNKKIIKNLENKLGFKIGKEKLYKKAFIHRSYVNENPQLKINNNERLEFLGDAVLELVVTKYLFLNYPNKKEGELTAWRAALVCGSNLATVAKELNLADYLKLSKGEIKSGGQEKEVILAGLLEAVIGAIYLDKGYNQAKEFIEQTIVKYLDEIIKKGGHIDPKTYFQELAQDEVEITPTYEIIEESGPDHNKNFKIGLYLDDRQVSLGEGSSKQKAQQAAAQAALDKNIFDEENN